MAAPKAVALVGGTAETWENALVANLVGCWAVG